jgi:membrane-bound acyltransferase YfiQ involved in biofilm formation
LDPFLSQKLRFWSLVAMLMLVYVHAYNLHSRYLQPWTPVDEPLSAGTYLQYFLANGLLRFRIPILFAISGYLFAHHDAGTPHRERVKRRVRTLLVPYLLWSLIGLAGTWALEQFPYTRQLVQSAALSIFGPENPFVSGYSPGELLLRWLLLPVPFQLWFLRSLLVLNIAYPWLRTAVDRLPGFYFTIAGLFWLSDSNLPRTALVVLGLGGWLWLRTADNRAARWQWLGALAALSGGLIYLAATTRLLWVVEPALGPLLEGSGLLFFALGVWLRRRGAEVLLQPRWFHLGLFAALWLGLLGLKTWLAFYFEQPPAIPMLLLHKAAELLGILVMWFGSNALVRATMRRPWFQWLTGFAFMIYVVHVPLVNYATEAVLLRWPQQQLLTYLLLPLLVVAAAVGLGALLRRVAPAAYGLLTGGRGLS